MSLIKFKQLVLNPAFVVWGILFSASNLCTSILTAFANENWKDMDTQGHVLILVGIIGSWTNTLAALIMQIGKRKDPDDFDVTPKPTP